MKAIHVLTAALICFISFTVKAQTAQVAIGGDVAKPFTVNASTFTSMKTVTVKATDHDGKQHEYSGINLYDLITQAAAIPNNQLRGKALTKYLLVSCADGYQVVIALPEIDPTFTTQTVILANKVDGKAFDTGVGPYRLILPLDKRPARWARQVVSIDVLTAKK